MKKKLLLLSLLCALLCGVMLTSCDDDDYYPPYYPGGDSYLDRNLPGQWDLAFINGSVVEGFEKNFFDFYSDGTGKYYYYDNGEQYWEWIKWWCYDNGYDDPVLHIDYSSGSPLNSYYWFNRDYSRLYLKFNTPSGWVQYVYDYTGPTNAPRHLMEKSPSADKSTVSASAMRPGSSELALPKPTDVKE